MIATTVMALATMSTATMVAYVSADDGNDAHAPDYDDDDFVGVGDKAKLFFSCKIIHKSKKGALKDLVCNKLKDDNVMNLMKLMGRRRRR